MFCYYIWRLNIIEIIHGHSHKCIQYTVMYKSLCLSGMKLSDQPKVIVKKKIIVYVCEIDKSSDHYSIQHTSSQNSVEIRERERERERESYLCIVSSQITCVLPVREKERINLLAQ